MRSKISVIGAGNVGGACAQQIAARGYGDVVLVDIVKGVPQGKALDLLEATPLADKDVRLVGSNSYEETAGSEIVVITAGVPRRPGMSRDDLLFTNMDIISGVVKEVVHYSPNCILFIITNPLDAMAQLAWEVSGFPRQRVMGMSGILDTTRFRTFVAQEVRVSVEDVQALVLGGHGDQMVPLPRLATVGGLPLSQFLSQETIQRLVKRTVDGGGEIVSLMGTSAYFAPGAAAAQMADSIIWDKKRVLPCCIYLDGEYGIKGVFVGAPVKLGKGGVEEIIETELTSQESQALQRSAAAVRELVEAMHHRPKQS